MTTLSTSEEPYSVILHGDAYINNILFHYPSNVISTPDKVCLVDFQMSRYGSPALDLSFILQLSLTADTRRNYRQLLRVYHDSLCEFVLDLDSNPEVFSFSALEEEMKKYSAFGMAMALVAVPGTLNEDSGPMDSFSADTDGNYIVRAISSSFENMSDKCEKKIIELLSEALTHGYLK
ncbi:hypothetical protein ANN_25203 [Periplaneta americana]|uniref:CHK kinase-like domain-containing protein n=1 Tax=Periplaneta americana TaxID=6978 RepID=A0ABQ8S0Y6_PERAM|nr:hypothetical protein ANN_25203 [Periplaneta americana]